VNGCGDIKGKEKDSSTELKEQVYEIEGQHKSLTNKTLSHHAEQEHREKLEKNLQEAQNVMLDQHELGFNKDLHQTVYFYKIPLDN